MPTPTDVIVVGGGTCGCVLASRLSEDPARSVLLLESGPAFGETAEVPSDLLDASRLPIGPASPWVDRFSVDLAPALPGSITRGRVLGGSGAINGGYFMRAAPADFDAWPQSLWSWDQVAPFYAGSETDVDPGLDRRWHGDNGPMPVRRVLGDRRSAVTAEFVEAALGAGFAYDADKNAPGSSAAGGVGPVPLNVSEGHRISTAVAYLLPHMTRHNLRVQGAATVMSVVFDGTTAVGVEVVDGGRIRTLFADNVILAAGAVRSAVLLLRSGIGNADELAALGISTVVNSPGVGRDFEDHPEVTVPYRWRGSAGSRGPALEAVLHVNDIEIRPYTAGFDRLIDGLEAVPQVLGVGAMRSTARGSLRLRSSDPSIAPEIRHGYLHSADDRRALRDGVEAARSVLGRSARFEMTAIGDPLRRLGTSQHLSGTARMGTGGDPGAVVDERCRVLGTENLMVVDTSVFPHVPSRGPHATAVMVAERAAALMIDPISPGQA